MTERIRESSESVWQNSKRKKSGLVRWVFLDGNRLFLVSGVLAGVFSLAAVLSRVGLITVLDVDPITTLVSALIGGMLPFITVVLAIIQLTLAEEFGTTGTFRERLDETEEFRQNIEDHTGVELSPAEPNDFLRLLIVAIGDRVTELSENLSSKDEQLQDGISEYVQILGRRVDRAAAELEDAQFGTFDVISMTLDFSDAQYLYNTRHIQNDYADALSARENEILESIETLLDDVHVARLYFKTVYMQQELVNLSRMLLYVGFPALIAGGFLILMYGNLLELSLGRPFYVFLVSAMVTVVFAPFVVLLAYILRIATVAQWTAADFGPFLLQR